MGLDQSLHRTVKQKDSEGNLHLSSMHDTEIKYFRKFNALHGYMQNNNLFEGGGDDNCTPAILDKQALINLMTTCADELCGEESQGGINPTPGFFFGSLNKDEYYRKDLLELHAVISQTLSTFNDDDEVVYYMASY